MKPTLPKIIAAGIVLALCLGGVGWWYYYAYYAPIQGVKEAVKRKLIDPESAQFFDVKLFRSSGQGCGYVNARNKMGGYVGRKRFVASPNGTDAAIDPSQEMLKVPDETPSIEIPSFSTSTGAVLADSSRRLAKAARRYEEVHRIRIENEYRRAMADTFEKFWSEHCQ